jgi:hypothetical protein
LALQLPVDAEIVVPALNDPDKVGLVPVVVGTPAGVLEAEEEEKTL